MPMVAGSGHALWTRPVSVGRDGVEAHRQGPLVRVVEGGATEAALAWDGEFELWLATAISQRIA